jgi:predicted lipoprotein with Yx(FWY)xxD motif
MILSWLKRTPYFMVALMFALSALLVACEEGFEPVEEFFDDPTTVGPETHEGTIESVDSAGNQVTLVTDEGQTITATVDATTDIDIGGMDGTLEQIQPGARAQVEIDEDTQRATSINVETETPADVPFFTGAATIQSHEHPELGAILADEDGRALYILKNDSPGVSTCYDECAQMWPPLQTQDDPEFGAGVDAALVGTMERDDGTTQVTYNDWPLYVYAQDIAPGDVMGHQVEDDWGAWSVISPDGEAR